MNERLNEAAVAGDADMLAELISSQAVISDPANRVRRRDELIALFARRTVSYESIDVRMDFAGDVGDLVVLMGTESTEVESVPDGAPWRAGDVLHRRFTNVYRREEGVWRLIVKQSTAVSAGDETRGS